MLKKRVDFNRNGKKAKVEEGTWKDQRVREGSSAITYLLTDEKHQRERERERDLCNKKIYSSLQALEVGV